MLRCHSNRRGNTSKARLALEAVSTRVVMQAAWPAGLNRGQSTKRRVVVLHKFPLPSVEHLLLLLPPLQVVLLLRSKGPPEGWECALERRNGVGRGRTERPRNRRRSMGNSHLRNKERLPRVANAPDELTEGLKVGILQTFDAQIRSKEVRLIPIIHLETAEGSLHSTLGIQVNPSHPIRHHHGSNSGRVASRLARGESRTTRGKRLRLGR